MSESIADAVRRILISNAEPVWLPSLTPRLVETCWQTLARETGLDQETYSTARLICKDATGERVHAFGVPVQISGATVVVIPVEMLSPDMVRSCGTCDSVFLEMSSVATVDVQDAISAAFDLIAAEPGLLSTTASLVRAMHLLRAESDEHDTSFSYPWLPFSIFVSVPGPGASARSLRIAEAVLHEAMHLQLTLLERVAPLVTSSEYTFYSPWRQELRPVQGVLHAVYVFRVVQDFWRAVPASDSGRQFAARRVATIEQQLREIEGFSECPAFTPTGQALVRWLMRGVNIRADGSQGNPSPSS